MENIFLKIHKIKTVPVSAKTLNDVATHPLSETCWLRMRISLPVTPTIFASSATFDANSTL